MKETYELKVKQAQEIKTKTEHGLETHHVLTVGWKDTSLRLTQPTEFPFPVNSSVRVTIETSQTKLNKKAK